MPGKNLSRFLGNKKARTQLFSGIVVALLALTAVTGFFVALPKQASAASNYVYTEDFEGDTVGGLPDPSNSGGWYTVEETFAGTESNTYIGVSDYNSGSWTRTLYYEKISTSEADVRNLYMNFSTGTQLDYLNISMYQNGTSSQITSYIDILNNTGVRVTEFGGNSGTGKFIVRTDGGWNTGWAMPIGRWFSVNVTFNWTTHKVNYVVDGIDHGWLDFFDTAALPDDASSIVFKCPGGYFTYTYFDNLEIGSPTQLGSGPSLPSAPTGASATAYTNFDISLSGLDANSRITFPTATVDDTTGDIVWANETSYGVLTVSNDGVQQINLSWTKGSGATNTVIRYATSDPGTWTLSTGTELYNDTGTSLDHQYPCVAGTHYYYALWSWNASGYSESYATCDAIVGNASVTNLTIHIEDVGSGTALVPKENFTLYGNASVSYASLGAFDATTGNITLTTTYAGLPLAIGDKLYFEFKATVGAGAQPDGTYYDNNAQTLDCYVKAER